MFLLPGSIFRSRFANGRLATGGGARHKRLAELNSFYQFFYCAAVNRKIAEFLVYYLL